MARSLRESNDDLLVPADVLGAFGVTPADLGPDSSDDESLETALAETLDGRRPADGAPADDHAERPRAGLPGSVLGSRPRGRTRRGFRVDPLVGHDHTHAERAATHRHRSPRPPPRDVGHLSRDAAEDRQPPRRPLDDQRRRPRGNRRAVRPPLGGRRPLAGRTDRNECARAPARPLRPANRGRRSAALSGPRTRGVRPGYGGRRCDWTRRQRSQYRRRRSQCR